MNEFISLGNWLKTNNRQDIVDRWDDELNNISIDDISLYDKKKYYLKCPNNTSHKSELFHINIFHRRITYCECRQCKSLAQGMINKYGEDTFEKMWSSQNTADPWDIGFNTHKKYIWNCLDNPEHIYEQSGESKANGAGCTCCNSTSIVRDSLLDNEPSIISIWSDKNTTKPTDYSYHSGQKVWWKCNNYKHNDYERKISDSVYKNFRCPQCGMDSLKGQKIIDITGQIFGELTALYIDESRSTNYTYWFFECSCGEIKSIRATVVKNGLVKTCGNKAIHYSGANNPGWKGGITSETIIQRNNQDYKNWRNSVYAKDWYTCQCCGAYGDNIEKQAHHIMNFSSNPSLRYDINNGILLCKNCHYSTIDGSFHNTYGTSNNTPEQLEEYINNKRKQLGISYPFSMTTYQNGICLKPVK